VVDFFFQYYGPAVRAFAALDATGKTALRDELIDLWSSNNQAADDNTTLVEAEYLEVEGVRA
jgi:hypothetical protein